MTYGSIALSIDEAVIEDAATFEQASVRNFMVFDIGTGASSFWEHELWKNCG